MSSRNTRLPQRDNASEKVHALGVGAFTVLIILALISTVYLYLNTIIPNLPARIQLEDQVIANQAEPPYQYRILEPVLSRLLGDALPLPRPAQHIMSRAIIFPIFLLIYLLFYILLSRFGFTPDQSLIGVLLLAVTIPLTVTGYDPDGDYLTLLFYVIGFLLIISRHDVWLPVLIAVATFNREQAAFMIVFYLAFHIHHITRRVMLVAVASIILAALVFIDVRLVLGLRPTQYTIALHLAHNTDPQHIPAIALLWMSEVAGFVALCLLAYKKSAAFFKIGIAALLVYVLLFALNGNLWELGKFTPAYLILIPMGLQTICGQYCDAALFLKPTLDRHGVGVGIRPRLIADIVTHLVSR